MSVKDYHNLGYFPILDISYIKAYTKNTSPRIFLKSIKQLTFHVHRHIIVSNINNIHLYMNQYSLE